MINFGEQVPSRFLVSKYADNFRSHFGTSDPGSTYNVMYNV